MTLQHKTVSHRSLNEHFQEGSTADEIKWTEVNGTEFRFRVLNACFPMGLVFTADELTSWCNYITQRDIGHACQSQEVDWLQFANYSSVQFICCEHAFRLRLRTHFFLQRRLPSGAAVAFPGFWLHDTTVRIYLLTDFMSIYSRNRTSKTVS